MNDGELSLPDSFARPGVVKEHLSRRPPGWIQGGPLALASESGEILRAAHVNLHQLGQTGSRRAVVAFTKIKLQSKIKPPALSSCDASPTQGQRRYVYYIAKGK